LGNPGESLSLFTRTGFKELECFVSRHIQQNLLTVFVKYLLMRSFKEWKNVTNCPANKSIPGKGYVLLLSGFKETENLIWHANFCNFELISLLSPKVQQ